VLSEKFSSIIFLTSEKRLLCLKMLVERDIRPESLSIADDVKKVQRKLDTENKKALKSTNKKKSKK
jgi:DNA-damage-inducible protein D